MHLITCDLCLGYGHLPPGDCPPSNAACFPPGLVLFEDTAPLHNKMLCISLSYLAVPDRLPIFMSRRMSIPDQGSMQRTPPNLANGLKFIVQSLHAFSEAHSESFLSMFSNGHTPIKVRTDGLGKSSGPSKMRESCPAMIR